MQSRRSYLLLLGLIVAAVIGALLLIVPGSPAHRKATLGLDLQGGLSTVLQAVPPKGHQLTQADLDRSVSIMRSRIDKLGVSEPDVRKQGSNQIVIELAGVHDQAKAAAIIGKTAQLEIYDLETSLTGPSVDALGNPKAQATLGALLEPVQAQAKKGTPEAYYLVDAKGVELAGPQDSKAKLLKEYGKKPPKGSQVLAVPQGTTVVTCDVATGCIGAPVTVSSGNVYYLFKHDQAQGFPPLTGNDLNSGSIRADISPTDGNIVTLSFNGKGSGIFQKLTRDEYVRGQLRGTPQHFAIVLDGELKSTPYIDYTKADLADGISGGGQIGNIPSIGEARDLALVLQTGALPVAFVQVERSDVSATLGADSLHQAVRAALLGIVLVAVFLLLLYRFLGLVAVLGLAVYGALLYAAILLFNVTLTLPGFAGMILTIGVAADANVVIFERIKEEVRAGRSVRAAISTGYQKGFRTIVDANVVTAITALILFAVATAGVKGFALMLLIGTVLSLLTAVVFTRALLGLLAGFRWFDNPHFMGASASQRAKWLEIDFMRRRRTWFAISAAVIAISIISLAVRGLNAGIDFTGGTQVEFKTPKAVSIDTVRKEASKLGLENAVIQGRGSARDGGYQSFQLRTKSLTSNAQSNLSQDLQDRLGATSVGVKNVSASFGSQITHDAILAVVVSLILIAAYLAIRFDYKFAIPVMIALAHDLLITIGIYSLTGREVTASTVAAILTVLGYSIYDTIIVFDRIRENVPLMRRAPFASIVNVSIWETIRRSLTTTFITLLPIAALFVFGGSTLKDFAFAILIGVASGAYSSIFIAAPLLTAWKEREPEWRRRTEAAGTPMEADAEALAEAVSAEAPKRRGGLRRGPEPATAVAVAEGGPAGGEVVVDETPAAPAPAPSAAPAPPPDADALARRERRRQRRSSRPHGRPR